MRIAEQDMVSTAGGLSLSGYLPVVHSFSCFLSTRPNEQIYNNATERKIIYVGSLAGVIPGGLDILIKQLEIYHRSGDTRS